MKKNIGCMDRTLRFIAALALFSLYFIFDSDLRYLAFIGFVPLITAMLSICPAYCIIGVNTCTSGESKSSEKNSDDSCCGGCGSVDKSED